MNKKIYLPIAMAALLAGCTNDDVATGGNGGGDAITNGQAFIATIEGNATTRTTLTAGSDAEHRKVLWSAGDQIMVDGYKHETTDDGTTTAQFMATDLTGTMWNPHKAIFPASLGKYTKNGSGRNMTFSLPATYTFKNGKADLPMYATGTSYDLNFKNLCGILEIKVSSTQAKKVSKITVTSDKRMNGDFTVDESNNYKVKFTSEDALTSADQNTVVKISPAVTIEEGSSATFYVPIPPEKHNPLSITIGSRTMVMNQGGGEVVNRDTVYPITFRGANNHLLPGEFSVSATKTVQFTDGNLYWDGSDWHIEDEQTNFAKTWQNDHVSYLSWISTTDYDLGYRPYTSTYQNGTQTTTDKCWCGEENPITVDGVSGLYLLSHDEFNYLRSSRTNAASLFKTGVTVGSLTNCSIFAPDDYDYSTNALKTTYTLEEIEELGLVCLPNTGWFDYTSTPTEGATPQQTDRQLYWKSSSCDASRAWYYEGSRSGDDYYYRSSRWAYRLVR